MIKAFAVGSVTGFTCITVWWLVIPLAAFHLKS